MSRFLFVSPGVAGHINPPLAVAANLAARGHEVGWVGAESYLRPLVGPEASVFPTGLRLYRPQADRGMAAIRTLWEKFVVPFARFILPAMESAVASFRPDVIVADQHAVAGAAVATRHGLRWASLAPQAMELTRPLSAMPKVEAWIRGQLDSVWGLAGETGPAPIDLRFSPHLVIGFTSPLLTADAWLPPRCALVGPATHCRLDTPDFDHARLDPDARKVLVSVGTMSVGVANDFFARVVEALAPLDLQVILNAPPEVVPGAPSNVLVAERLPMLELLPAMHAVVGHGGLNTTSEALARALPLVLAPIRNDQPVVADQVAAVGAGLRVRFGRVTPAQLREAVTAVLDDDSYRVAAARVRDSFPAEGGAAAAATALSSLATY